MFIGKSGLAIVYVRRASTLIALLAVAACGDSPASLPPAPQLPPLQTGTWHLNLADGQVLPAMVAHRLFNGQLEQTFVDSSTLSVNADRTWQQRIYLKRAVFGQPASEMPVLHLGTWAPTDTGYVFVSDIAGRDFVIHSPGADSLRVIQRLVDFDQAGFVVGEFRRTRPAMANAP